MWIKTRRYVCELDSDSSTANDFVYTYPILLLSYLKKMNHLEGNVQEALFLQNKQHIKELIHKLTMMYSPRSQS